MTPGDLQSTNGLTVASTRAARRDQHDSGTTATPGDIVINLDGTYPGEKSSWDVAEVLLYDGNLDAADISALETYLIDKYGSRERRSVIGILSFDDAQTEVRALFISQTKNDTRTFRRQVRRLFLTIGLYSPNDERGLCPYPRRCGRKSMVVKLECRSD
jgi:hypothetical protein